MNRKDEFLLNEEVKKLLKEKGITDEKAVIIGYKLGHKYIDNNIDNALPTIIEKIAETTEMKYRTVSSMMHKALPIQRKESKPKAKVEDVFEDDFTNKPFARLLKDFKLGGK